MSSLTALLIVIFIWSLIGFGRRAERTRIRKSAELEIARGQLDALRSSREISMAAIRKASETSKLKGA